MSRSIIALSVFHLSERTVMRPYLICLGSTAMATLDFPAEGSKKRPSTAGPRLAGTEENLYWPFFHFAQLGLHVQSQKREGIMVLLVLLVLLLLLLLLVNMMMMLSSLSNLSP